MLFGNDFLPRLSYLYFNTNIIIKYILNDEIEFISKYNIFNQNETSKFTFFINILITNKELLIFI